MAVMQGFDRIQTAFPGCRIISGNTDSLSVLIKDPEGTFMSKMRLLEDIFDMSEIPISSSLFSRKNSNVPGMWKPICFGNILEFISLGPSSYSYLPICESCMGERPAECLHCVGVLNGLQKSSGIPKSIQQRITHHTYKSFLREHLLSSYQHNQLLATSTGLTLQKMKRRAFAGIQQTRFYVNENESVPFGHYSVPVVQ